MQLTEATKTWAVEDLWAGYVDADAHWFSWSEGWTETWDWIGADVCSECGQFVVGVRGEEHHNDLGDTECEGWLYDEGPMMNYYYPVNVERIGGPEEAARALADLPLVVINFLDQDAYDTEEYALALSGGGMDLSWEICEAYTRLGYLPPTHFARVPDYGRNTARECYILSAIRRSIEIAQTRLDHDLAYLVSLEERDR